MSNNGWNSEFNSAKGALLIGDGSRPIVRTVGTDGFVLTANSAQADGVEWASPGAGSGFTSIVMQSFNVSTTYTPTVGMAYCMIECIGAGGGGGSVDTPGIGLAGAAGGGGGGGYSRDVVDAATIGVSQVVTVGVGGAGGVAGGNGSNGGDTSVGVMVAATGGSRGQGVAAGGGAADGGSGGGAIIGVPFLLGGGGSAGSPGFVAATSALGGCGGSATYGGTTRSRSSTVDTVGTFGEAGWPFGGGGGGAIAVGANGPFIGGDGASGFVLITEYIV